MNVVYGISVGLSLVGLIGLHRWLPSMNYPYSLRWQRWSYGVLIVLHLGLLAALGSGVISSTPEHLGMAVVFSLALPIMISLSCIDILYYEIPNRYNALLAGLGIVSSSARWMNGESMVSVMLSVVGLTCFFLLLFLVLKGGLGFGDVKLAFALSWFIPLLDIPQYLIYTFFTASVAGLILLVGRIKKKEDVLPFGPFMVIGWLFYYIEVWLR